MSFIQKPLVGIVTIQNRFNYGNRLQNYATQRILERYGLEVESMVQRTSPSLKTKARAVARKALGKESEFRELEMSAERLAAFNEFNKTIHFRDIYNDRGSEIERYDLIVAGSDQIWAMRKFAHNERWAYLQFAKPCQRIALAPSLGLSSASSARKRRLSRYLKGFRSLSVREDSGAKLIFEATGREAQVLCDPTLVLHAEEWRAVASDRLVPETPYIFTYLLGSKSPEVVDVLEKVTFHGEIPIVALSDRERQGEPPAGPSDFISLVDHASHVVTDSFHAAVFSAIMQTPLTIVHRDGGKSAYSQMFGRLETLANKLSIKEKIYGSGEFDLSQACVYDGVSESIAHERSKYLAYLEECLDAQLEEWRCS